MVELREALRFVQQYPNAGSRLHVAHRRVALRRFPYLVCYQTVGDVVHVVAIVHAKRDPAWIRRNLDRRD